MSNPSVLGYVQLLKPRLGGAPAGVVAALENAARAIDEAAGVSQQEWDNRVNEFVQQREAIKGALADAILAAIPVGEVRAALAQTPWDRPEGFSAEPELGPLRLALSLPPLGVRFPGDPNAPLQPLIPQLPDRVAGSLNAPPVKGGGAFQTLPDGVRGALGLTLGTLQVSALGSLRQASGTPSFLAVLGVTFVPGIQIGFGFTLSRIGGLVGVNRRADVDALSARLRDGTTGDVLFASNPIADADRLLAALDQLFPPQGGRHLVGPTLRISWLQIAGGGLFDVDVGLIVELPGPSRIVLAGSARAEIPGIPPLLRLRIDFLGFLDFAQETLGFRASLVDSSALGIFVITGDALFQTRYGNGPYTVLSIGGFYPGFRPEPATLPPLSRVGLALRSPLPVPLTLRAEGYFAVTSNTLQLGARIEASISAGMSAVGTFGVDALIQFTPFHFTAAFFAGFRVEVFGFTFGGVRLDGTIDGPGPLVLSGRLTIETFLVDFSWHETFSLGGSGGSTSSPPIRLVKALEPDLKRAENLRARGGPDPIVVLRPRPAGAKALVSPLGELVWSQRRAPLGIPIDRFEGAPLGSTQSVHLVSPALEDAVLGLFSPGSYITLSGSEALNRPAFDELESGRVLGFAEQSGAAVAQPEGMQVYRKVRGEKKPFPLADALLFQLARLSVITLMGDRFLPPAVTDATAMVTVDGDEWKTTAGLTFASATAAFQSARIDGGVALAASDHDRPISLAGL